MVFFAVLAGLLAGVTGLALALGIDISAPSLAPVIPSLADLLAPHVLARVAAAVATLLGVLVVVPQGRIGGALLMIGAVGMALTFDLGHAQRTAVIPVVFGALAAVLAIYSSARRSHARA